MNYIWTTILNLFSYFNIFKKTNTDTIVEDIDKLDDIVDEIHPPNPYMHHYLVHNDPAVMSEWDYLVRLHIR